MNSLAPLKQICLIGVGLIGGSFVLDLKRKGLVEHVAGIDLNSDNLERAVERKVIDVAYDSICSDSIGNADLVLIATPVATLPAICTELAPLLSEQAIVSDVGSTKQSALAAFRQYLPQHLPRCVAAHPIAGSDRHGALAAQFGLYQDKKLILCPHEKQDVNSLDRVEKLWQAVGAVTYRMDAAEHDAVFAAVSHMPHMLAYSYMYQIAEHADAQTYLAFAASGFRDFTRIASSHPAIWTDICLANKQSLQALLAGQQRELAYLQQILEKADAAALYRYFEKAKQTRDDWQAGQ